MVAYIFQSCEKKTGWPTDQHWYSCYWTASCAKRKSTLIWITQDRACWGFFSHIFPKLQPEFCFFWSLTSLSCTPSSNLGLWCSITMSQLTEITWTYWAWVSRMSGPSVNFLRWGHRCSKKNLKIKKKKKKPLEKAISNAGPGIHRIIIWYREAALFATKMVTQ